MIEIEHTAHTDAPRDEVWRKLSDLQNWHEWGPWTKTDIDGEIRTMVAERKKLTGQPYVMKERVTALDAADQRFEYDLLSGLPIKNYHGKVTLRDAEGGGTDIHWQSHFDPPFAMGFLWRGGMLKVIRDVSEALARAVSKGSDPSAESRQ